ncbi:hypothetical protein LY78DRAFT_646164 [Colletotrichum sublineola]|uniref:NACHT-NTPase and P-loop NTPases N-terminal domain-containing protein n=1 Tax=Colletotrichum sublineola TaxID=1173701 RepID=A0A066X229_COLSU|nr:hypothetical protein LY78DRAFT_646164 [Colletotrichum sublineola]KDN60080.1 hypothetical protein CSUB01_06346 [Colletotrichum sublineola]
MEAIGAVAACIEILTRSVVLLEHARKAWVRQKNGVSYLQGVISDVKSTLAILEFLSNEPELRQDHVNKAAHQVAEKGRDLCNLIKDLSDKSQSGGGFKKFMDQLLDGPGEQLKLETLRGELSESKTTLILASQMAQVGLIRSMGKGDIIVKVKVVTEVDERVQRCPGLEEGLRLAKLLPQRAWKDEKGELHLTDHDLADLQKPPPYYKLAPLAPGQTRGVVQWNQVEGSTFFGGDVGKDGGDETSIHHRDELIVSNNVVKNGAVFFGGGTSAKNFIYIARQMNLPGMG